MTGWQLHPARNALIIAKRKAGVGPREIARQVGVSANVVAGVLKRAGLCVEPKGRGTAKSPIFKACAVQGLQFGTWRQVSAAFGISTQTLAVWRREVLSQTATSVPTSD